MAIAPPPTLAGADRQGFADLQSALARRRFRRRAWISLLFLLLAGLIAADRSGWLLYPGSDWSRYHGRTFSVTHVVDGDTIDLAADDGTRDFTRVRLWGVDCPEIAKPLRHLPAQPFGDEARTYTRSLVEGQRVRVQLQAHRVRDRYGRLLAYVWLPDGSMLNHRLLEQGLARADERWSHDELESMLRTQAGVQQKKQGIWSLTAKQRRGTASGAVHELTPAGHDGESSEAMD